MNVAKLFSKGNITAQGATNALRQFGHLLRWGKPKSNILDVGCGEGSVTRNILFPFVKDHAQKLVALDLLEDMIDFAKKENRSEEIEYRTGDIMDRNNIEEMKAEFDHIFSIFAAQLIPNTREFYANLHEILKPKGQIFIVTMTDNIIKHSFRALHQIGNKWSRYSGSDVIHNDYTDNPSEYLRCILEDVGYGVDLCQENKMTFAWENYPDNIRALIQMYQQMGAIPIELKEDYIEEHIRYCCKNSTYLGEPNKYLVSLSQVTCIASKVT